MKRLKALIVCVIAMAAMPVVASAEEWIRLGTDATGTVIDIDATSTVKDGQMAQAWIRQTPRRPQRDAAGKLYSVAIASYYFDCRARRFDVGAAIYHDAQGRVVSNFPEPAARQWGPVAPGSVAEMISVAGCALANADIGDDIRKGDWRSAGRSEKPPYEMFVQMDNIVRLDADHIAVSSRADYREYQYVDGIPFRYAVTVNVIDCPHRTAGTFANYFFISPKAEVHEQEYDPDTIKLAPIPPGTFAYSMHEQVCSAPAHSLAEGGGSAAEGAGGISVGTARATNKGYLVTSAHVVAGATELALFQDSTAVGKAEVVALDRANDVAILKATLNSASRLTIIPLAEQPVALGRSVFTLGFPEPLVMGQRVKMTSGQVSSTAGIQDDARLIQISIPIQSGNSGGPVIAPDGTSVGVVRSSLTSFGEEGGRDTPQAVNYAVKVAYVRPLIDELPDLRNYDPIPRPATADDLVTEARPAVFMVVARIPAGADSH